MTSVMFTGLLWTCFFGSTLGIIHLALSNNDANYFALFVPLFVVIYAVGYWRARLRHGSDVSFSDYVFARSNHGRFWNVIRVGASAQNMNPIWRAGIAIASILFAALVSLIVNETGDKRFYLLAVPYLAGALLIGWKIESSRSRRGERQIAQQNRDQA